MSQLPEWQQIRDRKLEMIRLQNAQIVAGISDPTNGINRAERRAYDAKVRKVMKRMPKPEQPSQVFDGDVYEMQRFEMPLKGAK